MPWRHLKHQSFASDLSVSLEALAMFQTAHAGDVKLYSLSSIILRWFAPVLAIGVCSSSRLLFFCHVKLRQTLQ